MNRLLLASAVVALATSRASADTKSWTALKGHVPADADFLLGVDLAAGHAAGWLPKVVASIPDAAPVLAAIHQACGIDPASAVSDFTAALSTKGDTFVVAFGLAGLDEAKLLDCANKLAKASSPKAKITSVPGKVTQYTFEEGSNKESFYAAWPAKDVVVVAWKGEDDKDKLGPYVSGKAVQGDLATYLGKVSLAGAAGWMAANPGGEENLKGVYGSVTYAKGTFSLSLKLVAMSAKDATAAAADAKKSLADLAAHAPAGLTKVLGAIKIATAGAVVSVDGSAAEADVPAAFAAMFTM